MPCFGFFFVNNGFKIACIGAVGHIQLKNRANQTFSAWY
jgi:hypothetical protein